MRYKFPVEGRPPRAVAHHMRQQNALEQLDQLFEEVREEVEFAAARWATSGVAVLLLDERGKRVGRALMNSSHADARLVIGE